MNTPIDAFWLLNSNVPRLSAEKDMRALEIAASAQAGDAMRQTRENLVVEMGEIARVNPMAAAVRDEEGFQKLKAMAA